MRRIIRVILPAVALILAPGCGAKEVPQAAAPPPVAIAEQPKLVRVEGFITLDGNPLQEGMVMFLPRKEQEGRPASGMISPDGSFELGTFNPGDGIVPGTYRVVVTPEAKSRPSKNRIPSKYTDLEKTPLECKVRSEGQKPKLELKS